MITSQDVGIDFEGSALKIETRNAISYYFVNVTIFMKIKA